MTSLFEPVRFARGPAMQNRIALSPMTSDMALPDGRITDDEVRWIGMRATGGFGLVMTSASYVQREGKGGAGQTGIWSDDHIEGLARLAEAIKAQDLVASLQLHHAGIRASKRHVPVPVGPSDDAETGSRGLSTEEVEQLIADFVSGAIRAERAGFHGVELHGAHGYVLGQFLSSETNRRDDRYGGSLANRARIIFEIIERIRSTCAPDFQLGLRLSAERHGVLLSEMRDVAAEALRQGKLDWLDMSLWDATKMPAEAAHAHKSLFSWFSDLPRHGTRLGVAGKILSASMAAGLVEAGADFVLIGRGAILHHDWPQRARADRGFAPVPLPVTSAYLEAQGLGPRFIRYMRTWEDFVSA